LSHKNSDHVFISRLIRQFALNTRTSRNTCKCYWQQANEKNYRERPHIFSCYERCVWFDQTQYNL